MTSSRSHLGGVQFMLHGPCFVLMTRTNREVCASPFKTKPKQRLNVEKKARVSWLEDLFACVW